MLDVLEKKQNQSQFSIDTWNLQVSKKTHLSGPVFELDKNTLNNKQFKERTKQKWNGMLL